ncbi:MAG: class D sortase [Bryobacteraceae bacterium]
MPAVNPWTGPPRQLHRGPTKPGVHSHNLRRRIRSGPQQPVVRALRVLFLLAGLAGLGYYGYSLADQYVYQAYANWTFDQEIAGHHVTFVDYLRAETLLRYIDPLLPPAPTMAKASSAPEPDVSAPPRPANGDLLGRLEIPRLNLAAIVREGVDDDTLRRAVGHIPSTALPGEAGNFSIAAHRDTLFRALKDIRKDDRVTFQSDNRTFTYEVVSTRIVKPTDISVLEPEPDQEHTPQKTLTMITCYPFYFVGSAPERFIVKARLVEDQPETGAAPLPPPRPATKPAVAKPVARPSPTSKSIASAQHRPRQTRGSSHQLTKVSNPPNSSRHNVGFWHKLANVFTRRSD